MRNVKFKKGTIESLLKENAKPPDEVAATKSVSGDVPKRHKSVEFSELPSNNDRKSSLATEVR